MKKYEKTGNLAIMEREVQRRWMQYRVDPSTASCKRQN